MPEVLVAAGVVVLGLLMVSPIPYRSGKELDLRHSYGTLVLVVIALALVVQEPSVTLFVLGIAYCLSGPIEWLWRRATGAALPEIAPAGAAAGRAACEVEAMTDTIRIFDTTLRDGEQSPGCSMNLDEKLRLARQLERLGVDVIEAGFPIASEGDFEAVRAVARELRRASRLRAGAHRTRGRRARARRRSTAPRTRASTPSSRPATST